MTIPHLLNAAAPRASTSSLRAISSTSSLAGPSSDRKAPSRRATVARKEDTRPRIDRSLALFGRYSKPVQRESAPGSSWRTARPHHLHGKDGDRQRNSDGGGPGERQRKLDGTARQREVKTSFLAPRREERPRWTSSAPSIAPAKQWEGYKRPSPAYYEALEAANPSPPPPPPLAPSSTPRPTKPVPTWVTKPPLEPPPWLQHRMALKDKFPDGWAPNKRLSREAMSLLRQLHKSEPKKYTLPLLADRFKVSPEDVRRILRGKFELPQQEAERREKKRLEQDRERKKLLWAEKEQREAAQKRFADMERQTVQPAARRVPRGRSTSVGDRPRR